MIARPPKRPRRPNERALVRSISIRDQSIVKQRGGITEIILAGSRPGADPLAQAYRSPIKALIPVAGKAMVAHVTSTHATHARIERIRTAERRVGQEGDRTFRLQWCTYTKQ